MATKKLYDIDAYIKSFEGRVIACRPCENGYEVCLDQTAFFPEEGGQTPDRGYLGGVEVVDVQIRGDDICHYLKEPLEEGATVSGEINWQHRFSNMQQHSGEHIFSGLAYRRYGCANVGFHLSDQIVTMDFDRPFTETELEELEDEVNAVIVANRPVRAWYPEAEELEGLSYRSKDHLNGPIRIVEIEGADLCACCAPHVAYTGEIGSFKIQTAQNYKGGTRISFLCGFRALQEFREKSKILGNLTGLLSTNQGLLADNVRGLKERLQDVERRLREEQGKRMQYQISAIPKEEASVLLFEKELEVQAARETVNLLVEEHPGVCGLFLGEDGSYDFIIGSRTRDCRMVAKALREELFARGGGSERMIQGHIETIRENILIFWQKLI